MTLDMAVMRAVVCRVVWTWVDEKGSRQWATLVNPRTGELELIAAGAPHGTDRLRALERLLAKGELTLPADIDFPAPVLAARAGVEIGGQS